MLTRCLTESIQILIKNLLLNERKLNSFLEMKQNAVIFFLHSHLNAGEDLFIRSLCANGCSNWLALEENLKMRRSKKLKVHLVYAETLPARGGGSKKFRSDRPTQKRLNLVISCIFVNFEISHPGRETSRL